MTNVLVIAGPTASGKSAVALDLAARLGGEIINADAMQVYDGFDILAASPTKDERARVPHHLYGVLDPAHPWSAGQYARRAAVVIDDVLARGRCPIVVGGTGLWLKALFVGLSRIPDVPADIVATAVAHHADVGPVEFRHEVLAGDPEMAALKPGDTQRHLRAWSVFKATGRPLSEWQKLPPTPVCRHSFRAGVLAPPRPVLYNRCNDRFEQMFHGGAIAEVEALLARGLPESLSAMKAIGVPEIVGFLRGELDEGQTIDKAQQATRHLAKRQMTWFRGQAGEWPIFETPEALTSYLTGA